MPASEHVPARDEARRFFEATAHDYDEVVRWATLGQDVLWKRRVLARLPRGPAHVLDYACGTGLLTLAAARRCAPGHAVGVDASAGMVARAHAKALAGGVRNVSFLHADAEEWEPPERAFDAVLAGYLPKYVGMDRWLPRAARALRPGGALLAYDFTLPRGRAARSGWEAWWRVLGPSLARRPAWSGVAEGLPGLVRSSRWLDAMLGSLPQHGFTDVRTRRWALGAATLVMARRAPEST